MYSMWIQPLLSPHTHVKDTRIKMDELKAQRDKDRGVKGPYLAEGKLGIVFTPL